MSDSLITSREPFKVTANSDPKRVSSAISRAVLETDHYPTIRVVGHGAIGQATKALAISRSFLAKEGIDLAVRIEFKTVDDTLKGGTMSLMVFTTFNVGQ